jgi:hypothetical protein
MTPKKQRQRGRAAAPPNRSRYPSPTERERIIARREELLREFIMATLIPGERDRRLAQLVRQHGPKELGLVMAMMQKSSARATLIGEEAHLYRNYREAFARFGGARPFLSRAEQEALMNEYTHLSAPRMLAGQETMRSEREQELYDLLLIQIDYWADITPPAVPPRPPDFHAPEPKSYSSSVRQLLVRGADLNDNYLAEQARRTERWVDTIPELLDMALDEGLLEGWPGEAASWAPYHALVMLGLLQAHEYAGDLLALLDRQNDWLSDRLPVTWARMGPQAEPPLWAYLDRAVHSAEQRGAALSGLQMIAQRYAERRTEIIQQFTRRLDAAAADDAEFNAYLVFMLRELDADEADDVIARAFEQNKVDTDIVTLDDDIDELDDDML